MGKSTRRILKKRARDLRILAASSLAVAGTAYAQDQAGMSRGAFKQRAVAIDQATGRAFWWTYANGTWVSGK